MHKHTKECKDTGKEIKEISKRVAQYLDDELGKNELLKDKKLSAARCAVLGTVHSAALAAAMPGSKSMPSEKVMKQVETLSDLFLQLYRNYSIGNGIDSMEAEYGGE